MSLHAGRTHIVERPSNRRVVVGVTFHLGLDGAPRGAGLLESGQHLLARLDRGIGGRVELLTTVRALNHGGEGPQAGVEQTRRSLDVAEHRCSYLVR